jgi:putative N-acetylmannosamine-6-phosphate epimerase
MKITQEQYKLIESHLPKQRGNVRMEDMQFINAIMYVAENGIQSVGRTRGGLTTKIHNLFRNDNRFFTVSVNRL